MRSISASSSSPFAASRIALVATASTCSTPVARQNAENDRGGVKRAARPAPDAAGSPPPFVAPMPAPMRTASRISSTRLHQAVSGLVSEHHQPPRVRAHVDHRDPLHARDDARNPQFPRLACRCWVVMNATAQASAAPVIRSEARQPPRPRRPRRPPHRRRRRAVSCSPRRPRCGRPARPGRARRRDPRLGALLLLRARVRRRPDRRQEADEAARRARRRPPGRHARGRRAHRAARGRRHRRLHRRPDRDAGDRRAAPADRRPRGRDDRRGRLGPGAPPRRSSPSPRPRSAESRTSPRPPTSRRRREPRDDHAAAGPAADADLRGRPLPVRPTRPRASADVRAREPVAEPSRRPCRGRAGRRDASRCRGRRAAEPVAAGASPEAPRSRAELGRGRAAERRRRGRDARSRRRRSRRCRDVAAATPSPSPSSRWSSPSDGRVADESRSTVKSVETVSAIDLVMGGAAEEDDPSDDRPRPPRTRDPASAQGAAGDAYTRGLAWQSAHPSIRCGSRSSAPGRPASTRPGTC